MMGWFPDGVDGINTTSDYMDDAANFVEQEANEAEASATAAEASNVAAAGNAAAAAASAGATVWVTGSTYTAGVVRYSPTNFSTYRDTVGGLSSTDPASDDTGRWQSAMLPSAEVIGLPSVAPTIIVNGLLGISNVPMTVTRASVKSYYDARGFLRYDAAGVLSKTHDPKTKAPVGYLISTAATYLALQSEAVDTLWTKSNVTVTPAAAIGLDGALSMYKVEAATTGVTGLYIAVTATSTSQYFVIRVKKGSGATVMNRFGVQSVTAAVNLSVIDFNYDTGVITHAVGSGGSAVDVGGGIWELRLPVTSGVTVGDVLLILANASAGAETAGDFFYMTQPQLSDQPNAPYHPTAGSNETRPADVPVISGNAFADNWNPGAGTVLVRFTGVTADSRAIVEFSNGSGAERILLGVVGTTLEAILISGSATVGSAAVGGVTGGTLVVAMSFSVADGVRVCVRGHAEAATTLAAMPAVSRVNFGGFYIPGYEANAVMAFAAYLPRACTSAELRALVNNA